MRIRQGWLRGLLALVWPALGAQGAWAAGKPTAGGAEDLLRTGRFAEAETALAERLAARPGDPATLLGLGHLALLCNRLDVAEQRLLAALEAKPKLKEAQALLGEVYYRRDDFERAAPPFARVGQAAKARKLASFAGQRPYEIDDTFTVARLPFLKTDPLPVVLVRINGGGPVRFIVDTGGGELILDRNLAQEVGAARFGSERSYFAGGKTAAVEHGRVDSVRLGDLDVRHVPVAIMDLGGLGPVLGETRIDGIVGTVLLYHFLSTIDYAGGQLVLERRSTVPPTAPSAATTDAAPSPAAGETVIPFWMADDHFMVAWGGANAGPEMLFFVDTGLAGAGFACPRSTLDQAAITPLADQAGQGTGAGGSVAVVPFVLDTLRLGELRRSRIQGVAGVFPPQLEWDLGFHIGGLISHEFFRPGALTLDFAAMRLRFRELAEAATPTSRVAP
jgi:hypothetical protein